jgi:hypothetical protein
MSYPEIQPGRNGHGPDTVKAPPQNGGAFHIHEGLEAPAGVIRANRKRTVFPADAQADSFSSFLYKAYRHEVGAIRLTRWLIMALLAGALGLLVFRLWWLGGALAVMAVVLIACVILWRRRDFVDFQAEPLPAVTPTKLRPSEKLPIYATGHFSVEDQYARYTYLPGYYRSFPTREHALLCLVRPSSFLRIATWPPEQTGMWYSFFTPALMHSVRYGMLHFNRQASPAIAVEYDFSYVKPGRSKEQILRETIYIACADHATAARVLADLLVEGPVVRETAASSMTA